MVQGDLSGVPSYGPCGDSNLAMKAIIQGGKNAVLGTPFGHVHRAQHEVGFNKRTFEPQSQVPDFVNTINSSVFTISTTMGHLMQHLTLVRARRSALNGRGWRMRSLTSWTT